MSRLRSGIQIDWLHCKRDNCEEAKPSPIRYNSELNSSIVEESADLKTSQADLSNTTPSFTPSSKARLKTTSKPVNHLDNLIEKVYQMCSYHFEVVKKQKPRKKKSREEFIPG